MSEIYTLYTRSNFDGLVCAALLKEIGIIDEVKFVHPKDVQDGKIQLGPTDITASLPYCSGVYMAFGALLTPPRCAERSTPRL